MRKILTIVLLSLSVLLAQGQITIGGNVYGGGNEGDVTVGTSVTVRAGDLNEVYGGARMANVDGNTFVMVRMPPTILLSIRFMAATTYQAPSAAPTPQSLPN